MVSSIKKLLKNRKPYSMKTYRLKSLSIVLIAFIGSFTGSFAMAQNETLDSILAVSSSKNKAARVSQAKIDKLSEQTRDLYTQYKTVMKQVDGLKVYNARLQRQIDNQIRRIAQIEASIDQVTVIQRQMTPLVIRMVDGLEQFVSLDVPFHLEERQRRVEFLRNNLDRSDVTVAEKFRQALEAYKIENEYGRKIDTYEGSVEIAGVERDVSFLRIGRIALLYQSIDGETAGAWDQDAREWVELDGRAYQNAIRQGIRIADKTAVIDLMNLPVSAPEAL